MRTWWAALVVFFLVLAAYWPVRNYSFVRLDDADYVYQNEHIQRGLDWDCLRWSFTDVGYASNWHPLTWISHALDVTIARTLDGKDEILTGKSWAPVDGTLAQVSHIHNLILQGLNAVLLLFLLLKFSLPDMEDEEGLRRRLLFCGFLTLLWAIHPLRCEVVDWVSERKELLSATFMMVTLLAYQSRRAGMLSVSLAGFVLALLSKPVAVSLPAILVTVDWVLRGERLRRVLLRVLPFAILSLAVCVLTMCAQKEALDVGVEAMDLHVRLVSAVEAPFIYLRQTIWPSELCVLYETTREVHCVSFIGGLLLLAMMVMAVVQWLRTRTARWRIAVFAVSWCYVGLIPMLGLVKVGGQPHSDRYTYWIGCGVAATLACVHPRMTRWVRNQEMARVVLGAMLFLFLASAGATLMRNGVWRNSRTLYADTVLKTHDEESALILADELCRTGKDGVRASLRMLREVFAVRKTAKARAGLSLFLSMFGTESELDEARLMAQWALEEKTDSGEAHAAMGFICRRKGKRDESTQWFMKAFALGYENSQIRRQIEQGRATGR